MKQDLVAFIIPKTLDEPEKILFFTYLELAILIFPIITGIVSEYIFRGMVVGILFLISYKKINSNGKTLTHFAYWYFPHWLFKLNYIPPSYVKIFV